MNTDPSTGSGQRDPDARWTREAGVLLHVTSLPGPYGIGDLGPQARAFVDWAAGAGLRLWQVLPLNPPGSGNSPYSSFSSFAGSPLLISPDDLAADGFAREADLADLPPFSDQQVDYHAVTAWKSAVLRRVFDRFQARGAARQSEQFEVFCRDPSQAPWLEDFCLFAAIKQDRAGQAWHKWPRTLAAHDPQALAQWESEHEREVQYHRFVQFLFWGQCRRLKTYAAGRGVRLVGDLPIYVALDSADVWAHQDLFELDKQGKPTVVAGVPPDYFSRTGQLWGNPLYRWAVHKRTGFAWWRERLRTVFRAVDVVRLDHFRGFAAYWEVLATRRTARKGRWVKGPGAAFFQAMEELLAEHELIAEDLGLITPDVAALREQFDLPGMHVLQFAFVPDKSGRDAPDPSNPNLPYRHRENAVVYTGTHDNDTTRGWYGSAPETERHIARTYLSVDGGLIHWDLLRTAFSSVARWAIAPVQDILGLGRDARMNTPGVAEGNWTWRLQAGQLGEQSQQAVLRLAQFYGRVAETKAQPKAAENAGGTA